MLSENVALRIAEETLSRALDLPVREQSVTSHKDTGIDAIFSVGGLRFLVQVKSGARSESVSQAINQLNEFAHSHPNTHPLLVVPSMGDTGAEICERHGMNWLDLRGNASIRADKYRVFISGRNNHNIGGLIRPSPPNLNPFSRKAGRIIHAVLSDPKRAWKRSELDCTGLDKGYISKIVAELLNRRYLYGHVSQAGRTVTVPDPLMLLDAWNEHYHRPSPAAWGLMAVRDGFEAVKKLTHIFRTNGVEFAFSGLAAAAKYSRFGSFRRVDAYVSALPSGKVLSQLHVDGDERGRNVVLAVDQFNVSLGVSDDGDARYVSPALAYNDLSNLPERSEEAREEMRRFLVQAWK